MNIHLGGVAHAFNPSTWEAEQGDLCEFNDSLVYRVSSRTAGATGRPCFKKTEREKERKRERERERERDREREERERALCLRALAVLAEYPALIPNTHKCLEL